DADVFDASGCADAGGVTCGTPPKCTVTNDDPLFCANGSGCGTRCNFSQYCQNGSCACRPRPTSCGTSCGDIVGDEKHCGDCTTTCNGSNTCVAKGCNAGSCPSGRVKCGKSCLDVSNDPTHCGTGCGDMKACNPDQLCIKGACTAYSVAVGCTDVSGCDCTTSLGGGWHACSA